MNLLALYGLKWNPFSADVPSEALWRFPRLEHFCWRIENQVRELDAKLLLASIAARRGFHVILASDACETLDVGSAEAVQILFGRVFGYVMPTEAILHWLKTGDEPRQVRLRS